MINKIIAEYLRTNKRLVVPHFGAFIRKENSEAIVFVPFLKKDDGVLQQLLVSEYGMDSADAQAVIDEYIAEIKESIAARGAYVIEGVGRLMTDSNGICYLELGAAPAQAAAVRPADTGIPGRPGLVPGTIGRAGTAYEDSAAGASDGKNRQTRRSSSLPAIARPQAGGAISARYPPEQPGHFPVGARRPLRQSPSYPHASSGRPARTDFPNTHAECPPRNPAAPAAYVAPRTARRHGIPSVAPGGQTSPQVQSRRIHRHSHSGRRSGFGRHHIRADGHSRRTRYPAADRILVARHDAGSADSGITVPNT